MQRNLDVPQPEIFNERVSHHVSSSEVSGEAAVLTGNKMVDIESVGECRLPLNR